MTHTHYDNERIQIIPTTEAHADGIDALMASVYHVDPRDEREKTLNAAHIRQHLHVFPEGQFVAVDTTSGQVVGVTVSMRIAYDPRRPLNAPWWELIGHGWLTTHAPRGEWLYGVESAVLADYRGFGIGRRLMDARRTVVRKLNLVGMVCGSAIIDYHKAPAAMSPRQYVDEVMSGQRFDTNLSKQIKMGFRAGSLIPNYLHDADCRGWGVEIVWDNPDYIRLPNRPLLPRVAARRQTAYGYR